MKIAILGWGSLIWSPRELPTEGAWQHGGPRLPIEFSRVSSDRRLTLVIDQTHGRELLTRFIRSPRSELHEAAEDLGDRERTSPEYIGFVCVPEDTSSMARHSHQPDVSTTVRQWCTANSFDAAVWTALLPTFPEETGLEFSPENAIRYLLSLSGPARERAYEYIRRAPPEIVTPVREAFAARGLD